jgi:hypothetical protein
LKVKCIYHFRNEHSDSDDFYHYLYDWYSGTPLCAEHIIVGFDPCLVAKEDYMFSEYSKVSVEFQLVDKNHNLLPLDLCQVVECGVRYWMPMRCITLIWSCKTTLVFIELDWKQCSKPREKGYKAWDVMIILAMFFPGALDEQKRRHN